MRAAFLSFFEHVEIVSRVDRFAVRRELLATNYLVRQGACLGLLCELCATGGYSQVESSGEGGMRWAKVWRCGRVIYYIYVVGGRTGWKASIYIW